MLGLFEEKVRLFDLGIINGSVESNPNTPENRPISNNDLKIKSSFQSNVDFDSVLTDHNIETTKWRVYPQCLFFLEGRKSSRQ